MAEPPLKRRRKPPSTNAGPKAKPDKPAAEKKKAAKRATHQKAKRLTSREASSPPSKKRTSRKKAAKKVSSRKKVHRSKKPTELEEPASEEAVNRKLAASKRHRGGRRKATASELNPVVKSQPLPRGGFLDPFTLERRATILKLVQDGAAQSYSAHIAGVSSRVLQRWLRRGRTLIEERDAWIARALEGEPINILTEDLGICPEPDEYSEFATNYDKADAESIVNVAQCILDRALARDGFVLGGTISESEGQGGGSKSTSVRNGTIECAMWWLERKDNRMFGKGALRPREDDERSEDGRKVDPVAALLEHINRAFGQAPSEDAPIDEGEV